jgi:hypothetical protein
MKLKAPLDKYYDCKIINKYKDINFEENDKYIIISHQPEEQDEGIWFYFKQRPFFYNLTI